MKLLFSEARPDYAHYIHPYVIWGFPEADESAADFFEAGFLPSSRLLDRFYLCRQVRVDLAHFEPSSENRRILRKCQGIECTLVSRSEFELTPERRAFCKAYTETRFSNGGMSLERLDSLFSTPVTSHLLVFTETDSRKEVGIATLFLQEPRVAYYYYAFFDVGFAERNLGMFMMTSAVSLFASRHFQALYLGTCYSQSALYKTQFNGFEFFNGVGWSSNLDELKYLLQRQHRPELTEHLLEDEPYRREFHEVDLVVMAQNSGWKAKK